MLTGDHMRHIRDYAFVFILAFGFTLTACGDDPPSNIPPGADAGAPDSGPDGSVPTGSARLTLLTEAEPTISFSERVAIRVQYLSGNNAPQSGTISLRSRETAEIRTSRPKTPRLIATIASVDIVAGIDQVDFDVTISVLTMMRLPLIVESSPTKDSSDYLVRSTTTAHSNCEVEVMLYDSESACDDLEPSATANPRKTWPP